MKTMNNQKDMERGIVVKSGVRAFRTNPASIRIGDQVTFDPDRPDSVMAVVDIRLRKGAGIALNKRSFSSSCDLWEVVTDKGIICVRTDSTDREIDAPLYVMG